MSKEKTPQDLINSPVFAEKVKDIIDYIKNQRRINYNPNYRYRRTWIDTLLDDKNLNKEYFVKHIESIWDKKSNLSSSVREGIREVCYRAAINTIIHNNNFKDEKDGK